MSVYIVTVAEAQARFPELIARIAAGDRFVVSQDGKSVATIGRPPVFPTTPEEVEVTRPAREAAFRGMLGVGDDAPVPPPDGMSMEQYLATYRVTE